MKSNRYKVLSSPNFSTTNIHLARFPFVNVSDFTILLLRFHLSEGSATTSSTYIFRNNTKIQTFK